MKLKLALVLAALAAGAVAVVLLTRGPVADGTPVRVVDAAAAAFPRDAAASSDAEPLPLDYDPTERLAGGANPVDVFLAEPRHPTWAAQVEAVIGKRISRDLQERMPEARGMGMTCHSLSCVVLVDAPAAKLATALAISKLVTLGPFTVDLPPTEDGKARWLFFADRRMADAQKFTDWYLGVRKRALADIKAAKRENPFPGPAAELPDE
jgi:hypothetical protein